MVPGEERDFYHLCTKPLSVQREQYAAAVAALPVFYQPWWLDAVCGVTAWSAVASYDAGGQVQGVLPCYTYRHYGLRFLAPPRLSPNLGPWLFYPPEPLKPTSRYDFDWRVLADLEVQLPPADYMLIKFPYAVQNFMPWQRRGWQQHTRYSYVIPADLSPRQAWAGLAGRTRTVIRKAERQGINIEISDDLTTLYQLTELSFRQRGSALPFTYEALARLDAAAATRGSRRLYLAYDAEGRAHAAVYTVSDQVATYNLLQGSDPALRQSGAAAALLWRAIRESLEAGRRFDFEGSRIPGVEEFFRGFGGSLWTYGQLEKAHTWRGRAWQLLRLLRER